MRGGMGVIRITFMEKTRYLHWRRGWVEQHLPSRVAKMLDGVFPYTQVKFGNFKKGEGDIVIINLGNNEKMTIEDYLGYMLGIDRIVRSGIYTNVHFSKKFFKESLAEIING